MSVKMKGMTKMKAAKIATKIATKKPWVINISAARFGKGAALEKRILGPRTMAAVRKAVLEAVDAMMEDPSLLDDPDLCIFLQWNN